MDILSHIWFVFRWWRWFVNAPSWPVETLYSGPHALDKESRRIIIERTEWEWLAKQPTRN